MIPWYRRPEVWIAVLCLALGAALKVFTTGPAHEVLEYLLMSLGGGGGVAAASTVKKALAMEPPPKETP
jgi:hypothetical protein